MKAVIVDYKYLGDENLFLPEIQAARENDIELWLEDCKTEEEIINVAKDADAIHCCGNPPITRRVIENLDKCRFIIRYGIGVNSVDLEAATEHGKVVYNMPGFCTEELAIHSTALILSLLRNVNFYDTRIRAGEWPKAKGPTPRRLSGMILGLYGFGGSAKPMAEIFGKGFNSKVITNDPFVSDEVCREYGVEKVSFDQMLEQSDIISINAPLNESTYHIFNKDAFKKMKNNAMIVNIARGPLINEEDLIEALKAGEIKFAGLDVFEKEPISNDNPLLQMENVVLTPHSAFYGEESLQNQHNTAARLLVESVVNSNWVIENIANRQIIKDRGLGNG
ncbi:C-terminal binding protein [Gudongella sp. SC589]|uniref:C-terminal binding protein n=1 Tax=Gudongella sp. SC589 TaxID=3385990 RepID=UPI003904799A